MQNRRAIDRAERPGPDPEAWRRELPSWLMSLVLHVLVLLALGLTFRLPARQGTGAERTAEVGIALKQQEGDREFYQTGPNGGDASATADGGTSRPGLGDLVSNSPPVDPRDALPSGLAVIGPHALGGEGIPSAGGMSDGRAGRPGQPGGKGRTSVFGVTGEGWKFAYVFDRSESMKWHHGKPLSAAKDQLLGSLESLDSNHRFQIIFYNQEPAVFNPSGQPNRLAFATEQNKRNARKFVAGVTATGGTNHVRALMRAIELHPDVIFFLTDADEPVLSPRQLHEIGRRAAGVTIHAIEFGFGPQRDSDNFLAKLAQQNGGEHKYVDVSRL
jgi:hypothetical protein